MEDPLTVWKSLTTQGNIIEDIFSFILGAIVQKFDMDVMQYMSYAMFYSIGNQFICSGEEKILISGVSKTQHLQNRLLFKDAEYKGELEASRRHAAIVVADL